MVNRYIIKEQSLRLQPGFICALPLLHRPSPEALPACTGTNVNYPKPRCPYNDVRDDLVDEKITCASFTRRENSTNKYSPLGRGACVDLHLGRLQFLRSHNYQVSESADLTSSILSIVYVIFQVNILTPYIHSLETESTPPQLSPLLGISLPDSYQVAALLHFGGLGTCGTENTKSSPASY